MAKWLRYLVTVIDPDSGVTLSTLHFSSLDRAREYAEGQRYGHDRHTIIRDLLSPIEGASAGQFKIVEELEV